MNSHLTSTLRSASICAALLTLAAGCGSHGEIPATASLPDATPSSNSWMRAEAKASDLLYVSDQDTNDLYVYSWPQGKLEGKLTGFTAPGNLCTDASGDVYVPNYFSHDIVEYAHGSRSPIRKLRTAGGDAYGCSVDPVSGDLAVTNLLSVKRPGGDLLVYKAAKGAPKAFRDKFSFFLSCSYDDHGNLFVAGYSSSGVFEFAELPNGGEHLVNITIDTHIAAPGGVLWNGKYITVGDAASGTIYELRISGSRAIVKGSTALKNSANVFQYWIDNGKVVATSITSWSPYDGFVGFWNYPAGGKATTRIPGFKKPNGVTISLAK